MIGHRRYEGAAGGVDKEGFGPVFLLRRDNGKDVMRGHGGQRDRVFEVSKIEVFDPTLSRDDIASLFGTVFLVKFTGDYYRGKVDRVSLTWADGQAIAFDYPEKA